MSNKPSFKEALLFWLKLGFISFGGPAGQVAIMHEYLVEKKRWISESRFLHALNYCMVLPGPEAQQLATYTGWLLHGTLGGLVAGGLFVLPSVVILSLLSWVYVTYGSLPWVYALFEGLKPAIIAIVILALIKIGKKSLLSPFHYVVAAAAFIGIYFFNVPFPLILLGAALSAFVLKKIAPQLLARKADSAATSDDESQYYINKNTVVADSAHKTFRFLKQVVISVLLWTIPLGLFYLYSADFPFWKELALFFTKAAFVTFGGAYAVLPYVAQVSVEKLHWLTELQMIDGLALGETTPGPLVMVLAFVGFMGAHNHFDASASMGVLGLLTTVFYTFLPCFFFVFAGAPLIERTQQNKTVQEVLGLVTAAVVGVILNLTLYLGTAVLFPNGLDLTQTNWLALVWVVVSFVALYRFKIDMMLWIGLSALFGLLSYGLFGF